MLHIGNNPGGKLHYWERERVCEKDRPWVNDSLKKKKKKIQACLWISKLSFLFSELILIGGIFSVVFFFFFEDGGGKKKEERWHTKKKKRTFGNLRLWEGLINTKTKKHFFFFLDLLTQEKKNESFFRVKI